MVQGREAMFRGRLLRCWQEEQQRSVLSFSMMVEQPNLYPLQCFGLILTLDTASSVLDKGRLSCAMCLNLGFERFSKAFFGTLIPQNLRMWQQVSSNSDIVQANHFSWRWRHFSEP